eukprot:7263077-Alexandrium_andersonii.AAC.2
MALPDWSDRHAESPRQPNEEDEMSFSLPNDGDTFWRNWWLGCGLTASPEDPTANLRARSPRPQGNRPRWQMRATQRVAIDPTPTS